MGLTIDDIYDKEFALKGGGYDRDDVDQFLDEICDEMTNMQEHISNLEASLQQAQQAAEAANAAAATAAKSAMTVSAAQPEKESSASGASKASQLIEEILVKAQRMSDEVVMDAHKQAEGIVKEAEDKASGMIDDMREEKSALEKEISTLKQFAAEYRDSYMQLLEKHRKVIDDAGDLFRSHN